MPAACCSSPSSITSKLAGLPSLYCLGISGYVQAGWRVAFIMPNSLVLFIISLFFSV
jgi:hypothetical protein